MGRRRRIRARGVMLTFVPLALSALLLAGGSAGAEGRAAGPPVFGSVVPGELIVRFKAGVPEASRALTLRSVGAEEKRRFGRLNAKLVSVAPNALKAAEQELEADPRVAYAEPNYVVAADAAPNDPSYGQLWGLHNTGQTVDGVTGTADADIDAHEAWDVATGSANVVVAVIDTGVDFSHPDLGGSATTSSVMWTNPGESCAGCRTDGVDNDGNGYVDDWRGWDFANRDGDPHDDNEHGTHVAGTIGAIGDNGVGVAGVSRGGVKIMALKFLSGDGFGTTADAVGAILYAASKGAHVMNNSWGGGEFSQSLFDAIEEANRKGSLFVAAAGNDGVDNDSMPQYPSSYEVRNVVSVASTTSRDGLSSFSNYGSRSVDLGAPGSNIYSTVPGNGYDYFDGTSMATPHVAGAAALAKAAFPGASHLGLKALLLRTVEPKSSLARTTTGGRLNVNNAVRCANAPKLMLEAPAQGFVANLREPLTISVVAANCANPQGVAVAATANGEAVTLTSRGEGLYTGTYTPTVAGALTINASATVGALTDSRSVTGTAADNYRFEDAPFAWIDATAGGTNTGLAVDDGSVTVALPFAFNFYRQPFTSVKVSSNGYLVFGPSSAASLDNIDIPNTRAPNGFAAPYWDDLNPSVGGSIWYRTTGTAPNRKFVVAWVAVPHWLARDDGITFEVILEEGTNEIVYQYLDVDHSDASFDYGASATIGVENLDGAVGRGFSYERAVLAPYEGMKALRFTQGPARDTTPPETTILTAPAAVTTSSSATFSFSSSEPGSFACSLDGAASTACSSPWTKTLADGSHTFRVVATDAAGNVDPTPATHAWTIDTSVSNPTLVSSSATGWSNDRTVDVTWSGASDSGSGVDGFSYEWSQSATTAPDLVKDAEEAATGTTSPELADGSWWFHLRTRDNAGNWSAPSHLGPFQIDGTAPANPAVSSATHTVGTWSTDPTVDVAWTGAADARSGVDGFSTAWSQEATTDPGTTKTAEEAAAAETSPIVPDGEWWFHLRTRDNAGNWSTTMHLGPFRIDTLAATNPVLSTTHPSAWSSDATVDVTWSGASDARSGVDGFSTAWSQQATTDPVTTKTAEQSATGETSPTLSDGEWWFHLRTRDNAGNWSATMHLGPFRIDTAPPGNPELSSSSHLPDHWSNDPTVELSWAGASDGRSGVDGFSYEWSQTATTSPNVQKDAEETVTAVTSDALGDGSWWFHLRTVDGAGNWSAAVHIGPFKIDTVAPMNPVLSSPSHTVGAWSNEATIVVQWGDVAGTDGYSYEWSQSSATAPDAETDAEGSTTRLESAREDGSWWFHLRRLDETGAWSHPSHIGPFNIDTTRPRTSISGAPPPSTTAGDATFELSASEPVTFRCALDGGALTDCVSPVRYEGLPAGEHVFRVEARDRALNVEAVPAEYRWTITPAAPPPPPPPAPPPPPPPPPPVPPPPAPQPPKAPAAVCLVPRLSGVTLARAKTLLARAGCRLGTVKRAYSSRAKGRVSGQRPRAGLRLSRGARVSIVVSRGLPPRRR